MLIMTNIKIDMDSTNKLRDVMRADWIKMFVQIVNVSFDFQTFDIFYSKVCIYFNAIFSK